MSDEGIVDLSDAPRHTGPGEDTGDATSGSASDALMSAYGKTPPAALVNNVMAVCDETASLVGKLFDGELVLDDLLAHAQQLTGLLSAGIEIADMAVSTIPFPPDPAYWLGLIAKTGLDAIVSLFQPLEDIIGMFSGNPDRIGVSGQMWGTASEALVDLAEHIGKVTIEGILPSWSGGAAASAALRLGEFQQAVHTVAVVCDLVKTTMKHTAALAEALMNFSIQNLADIVSSFIGVIWSTVDPLSLPGAIAALGLRICKTVCLLVDLAIRAARVFLALAEAGAAIQSTFESALPLLTRMSEAPN